MKRTILCLVVSLVGCAPIKHSEPINVEPPRAKTIVPVEDMGQEPVALARSSAPRHLELPINIAGQFPSAKECAMDVQSEHCSALWRYIETSAEMFVECMEYQSSEETPKRCLQLYDVDGDYLVTLADYHFFDAFHQFRWTQIQGAGAK